MSSGNAKILQNEVRSGAKRNATQSERRRNAELKATQSATQRRVKGGAKYELRRRENTAE